MKSSNNLILITALIISIGTGCGDSVNTAPIANAGEEQDVNINTEVTLDGSGSSDNDNSTLTYSWTQTSGVSTVTFNDSTAQKPTFTTPNAPDMLVFSLVVNDGTDDSDPATVTIRVWEDLDNRIFVDVSYSETGLIKSSSKMNLKKASDGSESAPYTTIGEAIEASTGGADVYVAAGTYTETIDMVEGVSIYGGYEADDWTRDVSANTTTITPSEEDTPTITAGSGVTNATFINGFTITGPTYTTGMSGAPTVSLKEGGVLTISSNTILGGLSATSSGVYTVYCIGDGDGLTISNNTITTGTLADTNSEGKAMALEITECTNVNISSNTISGSSDEAYSAPGGVYLINIERSSSATIQLNTLSAGKNTADDTAAILTRESGSATITRNRINGGDGIGSSRGSTGVFHASSGKLTIENNIIYAGNGYATASSGAADSIGVSLSGSSSADIVNNTIYLGGSESGSDDKVGIYNATSGTLNIVNNLVIQDSDVTDTTQRCIWRNNTAENPSSLFNSVFNNNCDTVGDGKVYTYLDDDGFDNSFTADEMETQLISEGMTDASVGGNLAVNAVLEDDSDYLLSIDSSLINAGDDGSVVDIPLNDFDGEDRPNGSGYDIGADEYYSSE